MVSRAKSTLMGRGLGPGGHGVKWYYDTLTPGMAIFEAKTVAGTAAVMEEMAASIEDYMKANAPWEDQSGDARQGLTADLIRDGAKLVIVIYHTVDYGLWLEVRWSGRYAIILPTIETMGPQLMERLRGVFTIL